MPEEDRGITDWKAKDKETYASAITKKMINLGIEAKEDGTGEYYEDAVLDFWTDIPTVEKHKPIAGPLVGRTLYPGTDIQKDDTPMTLFARIMKEYPPNNNPKDPKHRMRIFAIKQLTVDLYDEMEILRGRHRKSRTSEKEVDQEFGDWAPQ
jgi:hypothetical protein